MVGTPITKHIAKKGMDMAKYDYGGGCPCGLYRSCVEQCEHYLPGSTTIKALPKTERLCSCGPNGLCDCESKKKEKKMNEDDFGFSIVDETELSSVVESNDKAKQLRDMIMPLLNNLKANPDKDIIKWKGNERVAKIDGFIKKINKLVDG